MQFFKSLGALTKSAPFSVRQTCWRPFHISHGFVIHFDKYLNITSSYGFSSGRSCFHTSTGPVQSNKMLNLKKPTLKDAFYRRRDNISDDFQLIYRAPMVYTIAACKHFATFSLTFAGLTAAYKYANNMAIIEMTNLEFGFGPIMSEGNEMLGFGVGFLLLNITLLVACAKFPLRIYRHKSK